MFIIIIKITIFSQVITVHVTSNYGKDKELCVDEKDLKSCIGNERRALLSKIKGKTDFFVDNFNVYHRIQPSNGSIKFHWRYSITLKLLPQNEYNLMLFDPAYVIPSNNPELVARTSLMLKRYSIGNLYLKVNKTKYFRLRLSDEVSKERPDLS